MSWDFSGANAFNMSSDVSALDITTVMTLAVWAWPDRVNSGDNIISKWNNDTQNTGTWRMRCGPSGNVQCMVRGSSVTYEVNSSSAMTTTKWQHMGLRLSGTGSGAFSAWLDGTETTGTASQAMQNGSEVVRIAREGNGNNYDGRIAEAGLWNVALTNDEMIALARGTSPARIRRNALVCYWPMNCAGTMVDFSGNKSHPASEGAPGPSFLENDHPPVNRMFPLPY